MDIQDIAGLVGAGVYLSSYALISLRILDSRSYTYLVMNAIAPSLVLVSLMKDWNLAAAIIQVTWLLLSFVGLIKTYLLRKESINTTI